MRLIDADALASSLNNGRLEEQTGRAVPFNAGVAFALTMVEYAPTIDAVPVVRCKDCRHAVDYYHEGDCYCSNPKWGLNYFGGSWEFYCADAERRDDEIDRR